jgi:NTP pyrophosphatase (non-canonical NTP hydrolase)
MAMTLDKLDINTRVWAQDRELVKKENSYAQMCKLTEEIGEIAGAFLKGNKEELRLEIGDGVITLCILAAQQGLTLRECWQAAYDKISSREGQTINGTFLKDEN